MVVKILGLDIEYWVFQIFLNGWLLFTLVIDSLSPVTPTPLDLAAQQKVYRNVVLKDLIDSEKAHVTELQGLVKNFLRPLENSDL